MNESTTPTRRSTYQRARKSTKIRLRWGRIAATLLLAGVIAVMLIWALDIATSQADAHGGAPRCTDAIADAGGVCWGEPLPACQTEDSDNCYWDAATMGNGRGRSFVTVAGETTYTP
jgi:hypothetical protein